MSPDGGDEMDGELVRLTGTEWAVLDCLWEASPRP